MTSILGVSMMASAVRVTAPGQLGASEWTGIYAVLVVAICALYFIVRRLSELATAGEIVFFHCEKIVVDVPLAAASRYIRDVGNLPSYEQKVHSSRVISRPDEDAPMPEDVAASVAAGKQIAYQLDGGWCCYPWTASFLLTPTANGGFHSRIIPLRAGRHGVTMNVMAIHGGFALRDAGRGRTVVTHYESYRWSRHFALLRVAAVYRAMARWHSEGMRVEMKAVKVGMEAAASCGTSRPPAALEDFLLRSHLTLGRFVLQEMTGTRYSLASVPASLMPAKAA